MKAIIYILISFTIFSSCTSNKNDKEAEALDRHGYYPQTDTLAPASSSIYELPDTIIDASYSFKEAIEGSTAPQEIIEQLELFDVVYLSTDGQIHKGQILSNKAISGDIKELFEYMLNIGFVIEKAIPIVRYGWSDSLSMDNNNSYSFCYRDITYSKHATGMAIDINPRFNPLRYKLEAHANKPDGAVLDTAINGTLHPNHPVVSEFRRKGFRWGHNFTRYYDDHHFEKR